MPFVSLDDGETAILEIVSEDADTQFQHWIKGVAFRCWGDECPFCAKRVRRSVRFVLDVRWAGEDYSWGLSKTTYGMLQWLAKDRPTFKGMFVQLTRLGKGTDTQYRLDDAGGPPTSEAVAGVVAPPGSPEEWPAHVHDAIEKVRKLQDTLRLVDGDVATGIEATIETLKTRIAEDLGYVPVDVEDISF